MTVLSQSEKILERKYRDRAISLCVSLNINRYERDLSALLAWGQATNNEEAIIIWLKFSPEDVEKTSLQMYQQKLLNFLQDSQQQSMCE